MSQVKLTSQQAEVQQLKATINLLDCLSQAGFSEIASTAKLALAFLENPAGYRNLDHIANALTAIADKASDIENLIGCEAEAVGCNHVNEDRRKRWAAERTAREEAAAQKAEVA